MNRKIWKMRQHSLPSKRRKAALPSVASVCVVPDKRACQERCSALNGLRCKSFLCIAVMLLLMMMVYALFPVCAWAAIPQAPASFYAADYADILSSETERKILSESAALDDACGAQIVVVTVDFTDGMDIEDYAYKLFNSWEIGSSDRNNGLLILLVPGEENYWVMQGKGLESSLSSGTIQTILDTYMEPDFAAEDYDSAVWKSYEQFYSSVAGIYGLSAEDLAAGSYAGSGNYNSGADQYGGYYGGSYGAADRRAASVITVISVLVILFIVIVILRALFRGTARRAAGGYSAWGTRRSRSVPRRSSPPMGGPGHMPPPPGGHGHIPPPGGAGPGSFGGHPPATSGRTRSFGSSSSTRPSRTPKSSSRPASSSRRSSSGGRSSGGSSSRRTGGGGSTRGGGAGRK